MCKFSGLTAFLVILCFVSLNDATPHARSFNDIESRDTDLGIVEDFECPPGKGIAPHPDLCQYYYTCYSNITHLWKCDGDLVFDLAYDGCNYLYLTDCGNRIPPFKCPTEDGLFPLQPQACDPRYFECQNGTYTLETCPSGVFDTSSYTCSGTEYCPAKSTTASPPTAPGEFVCPEPDGQFPSPYTCTQFYVCVSGTPFLFNCPADLYYNPRTQACDFPYNVPECTGF